MGNIPFKRILLKISGEALADGDTALSQAKLDYVVSQVGEVRALGVDVGIVVGGGNFWRGRQGGTMERTAADHMGMLATVINAIALQDALEAKDVTTRVQTALTISRVAEPYILRKAMRHFEKGRVVIFACGTGNPYFSTDTGAALRAAEIHADVMLLAKNIDGVYDSDPKQNPSATKFADITFAEVIKKNLRAMDITATSMCMENNIPVLVFGLSEKDSIVRAVRGEKVGTYMHN